MNDDDLKKLLKAFDKNLNICFNDLHDRIQELESRINILESINCSINGQNKKLTKTNTKKQ